MPPRRRKFDELKHRRDFGVRVRALRLEREWSQEELAEAADLHRTYINRVEGGHVNVSIDAIERLAKGLGVPTRMLFE